jgi:hypothetical protein
MKVKTMQDIHDCWDEFFEVFQIEKDNLAKDSQRPLEWEMANFENSNGPHP